MTVTRANGNFGAVSVLASCVPGTATTVQYTCPTAVLAWAAGEIAQRSFAVTLLQDDVPRLQSWCVECGGVGLFWWGYCVSLHTGSV